MKIEFVSKYHHMSQNEFKVWGILITKQGYKENQMIGYEVAVKYISKNISMSLHYWLTKRLIDGAVSEQTMVFQIVFVVPVFI